MQPGTPLKDRLVLLPPYSRGGCSPVLKNESTIWCTKCKTNLGMNLCLKCGFAYQAVERVAMYGEPVVESGLKFQARLGVADNLVTRLG